MEYHKSTNTMVIDRRDYNIHVNALKNKLHRNIRAYGGVKMMTIDGYKENPPLGFVLLSRLGQVVGVAYKSRELDRVAIYPEQNELKLFIDAKPDILANLDLVYHETTKSVVAIRNGKVFVEELKVQDE